MSLNSQEMAIKNCDSLPRSFIQAVSHPTKMTRWQKIAFTTFLGAATGGVTFGVAFRFDAGALLSTSISVVAALVVLAATTILISKKRALSPEEFSQLNIARERARLNYGTSLRTPVLERDAVDIKVLNEDKKRYMKLLRAQLDQPLQEDEETSIQRDDGEPIIVPSRAALQKTLDDLTAS